MSTVQRRECAGVTLYEVSFQRWQGYLPWGALVTLKYHREHQCWLGGIYTLRPVFTRLTQAYDIEERPIPTSFDLDEAWKQLDVLLEQLFQEMRAVLETPIKPR